MIPYNWHIRHRTFTVFLILTFLLCIVFDCLAGENPDHDNINWMMLNTESTVIYYQNEADLISFNRTIEYPFADNSASDLSNMIISKIDAIFLRSTDILQMDGHRNKIKIKLFKNNEQLCNAFYKIYKKECHVRAWYTHEKSTVFVQLEDLSAGMLAHEFAHAIIDNYLIVPPPHASAEILARYVDTHLVKVKNIAHLDIKTETSEIDAYSDNGQPTQ